MIAWLNLRYTVPERQRAFQKGLKRLGHEVRKGLPSEGESGLLVTWNRIGPVNSICARFKGQVLVTENATWGNGFAGERWYTLCRGYHNTAGTFDYHGPERFDQLGINLAPYRTEGETVILPQRGIGSPPVAMPRTWPKSALKRHGGRIRRHPGMRACKPLEDDLSHCKKVVTWGSGAAVKAAQMGIEVVSEMPNWIAAHEPTEESRLEMFRRIAWAQWRLSEFESGEAFAHLL